MKKFVYCLILSAKLLIASWYAVLRFWADTPRHARTGIIREHGTIPVNTGCARSALTCRFKNGLPNKRHEYCDAIIFMSYLPYLKS